MSHFYKSSCSKAIISKTAVRPSHALLTLRRCPQKKVEEDGKIEEVKVNEARTEDAVLQGLEDARSRLQQTSSSSQTEPSSEGSHKQDIEIDGSSDYQNGSQLNDAEFEVEERQKDVVNSHKGGS